MIRNTAIAGAAAAVLALVSGCAEQREQPVAASSATEAAAAGSGLEKLVVAGLPNQTIGVLAAKQEKKTGDKVVLTGRVKDFVEGAAVLTVADLSLRDCKTRGDQCATPWDYCCETKEAMTSGSATVKLSDSAGDPLMQGLKGVGGIDHLVDIAAEGRVERDEAGNLIVVAEKLYVKQ
jgi:hypothetical protein